MPLSNWILKWSNLSLQIDWLTHLWRRICPSSWRCNRPCGWWRQQLANLNFPPFEFRAPSARHSQTICPPKSLQIDTAKTIFGSCCCCTESNGDLKKRVAAKLNTEENFLKKTLGIRFNKLEKVSVTEMRIFFLAKFNFWIFFQWVTFLGKRRGNTEFSWVW